MTSLIAVVIATEVKEMANGRRVEEKVALKFFANKDIFLRGVEKHGEIRKCATPSCEKYVVGMRAAYSAGELNSGIPHVKVTESFLKELSAYNKINLDMSDGKRNIFTVHVGNGLWLWSGFRRYCLAPKYCRRQPSTCHKGYHQHSELPPIPK